MVVRLNTRIKLPAIFNIQYMLGIWYMEFKCFEVILFLRTIKVLFNFRPGII